MDFLAELVLSVLFEAPFELTMESKRVKPWVKTFLYALLGGVLALVFGFMTWDVWADRGDTKGAVILALITIGWLTFVVFGCISGHKRGWKNKI